MLKSGDNDDDDAAADDGMNALPVLINIIAAIVNERGMNVGQWIRGVVLQGRLPDIMVSSVVSSK